MRYLCVLFIPVLLFCSACDHSTYGTDYKYWGFIEGKDKDHRDCCAGYIIKIDSDTTPYHFLYFPKAANIDSEVFPIKVILNYDPMENCGNIKRIKITGIQTWFRDPYAIPIQ